MDYNTEIINISKISEGIFIGDRIAGTNLDVILRFKITHMINSAGSEIINQFESIGIKYLVINWSENPNQKLFDSKDEIVNRIVSFIDESLKNGEGLLIHSVRGQDRVCIVVIIYLMKKYNWSLRKCIEFLHSKKQDIDIPNFFLEQLFNFSIRLDKINKGKKKENWNEEDNFFDLDEKLMRNTYVNGLPSDKNVKSENKIKKKRVGWADNNPYGRNDYLFSCNLKKDLFLMKDIKPVFNHLKMRPSKSCVKNKSKSVNSGREYVSFKDNNNNNKNVNRNKIYNIQPIKQNEIYNEQYDNNINKFTFGLNSNILEQINSLSIPKNNNNINDINNNININNLNKEFNNSIKQHNYKQKSGNKNIQSKQEENKKRVNNFVKDNNNRENNNRDNIQNQKRSNTYDKKQNINLINNTEQFNEKINYRNYSLIKEQNNIPNDNNKVIFAHNYEQIITNNINNYYIQNPESINNKKNPNQNNIKIFNKDYNNPSVITNISSSTIKNQLNDYINPISSNQKNNSLRNSAQSSNNNKNNQIKKPINYNNYFYENPENTSLNRFKIIDYSSENEQNNIMVKNSINQPQKNILNPNNNINYNNQNQFRYQFIGGINNYNPKNNSNKRYQNKNNNNNNLYNNNSKPINNYNPSLLRKAKTPLFTRQNNMNNGPIKIQNNQIKKPTTPDNINRKKINSPNMKFNYNYYGTNINSNNSLNKSNSKSKNNETIKRPSTAPQKDKRNNKNIIKGKNNNNNYNHMGQTMKRLPSPKIKSHNLYGNMNKTQKFNYAKYRTPSPMIKSKSLSLEPIKKNGNK